MSNQFTIEDLANDKVACKNGACGVPIRLCDAEPETFFSRTDGRRELACWRCGTRHHLLEQGGGLHTIEEYEIDPSYAEVSEDIATMLDLFHTAVKTEKSPTKLHFLNHFIEVLESRDIKGSAILDFKTLKSRIFSKRV